MQNLKILTVILTMIIAVPGFSILAAAEQTQPVLQKIQVTGTGNNARIEIAADKPLTYTYYKMPGLLKVIIDLALVDPGSVVPVTVNSDLISKITVEKKIISDFSLTRVVINLEKDAECVVVTDPADKKKLQVSFGKILLSAGKEIDNKSGGNEAKTGEDAATVEKLPRTSIAITTPPTATPAADEVLHQRAASETISPKPVLQPVVPHEIPPGSISAVTVNRGNILIVTGARITNYKAFALTNPSRLVIDVPHAKCSILAKDMPVKRFGVTKARVGAYPDKVRLVFDAEGKQFPQYKIANTDKGLVIKFPSGH